MDPGQGRNTLGLSFLERLQRASNTLFGPEGSPRLSLEEPWREVLQPEADGWAEEAHTHPGYLRAGVLGRTMGTTSQGALGSLLGSWLVILSGDNVGETLMHITQVEDLIRFILLCFFWILTWLYFLTQCVCSLQKQINKVRKRCLFNIKVTIFPTCFHTYAQTKS